MIKTITTMSPSNIGIVRASLDESYLTLNLRQLYRQVNCESEQSDTDRQGKLSSSRDDCS
jgi:hypothetical protein